MMSPTHFRKARAAAVLLILLASSAIVPVLTGYGTSSDPAAAKDGLFDAAVRRAADQMGDVAGTGEANPLLDQDAVDVPATFFHDRFDDLFVGGTNEDERIGGFGDWSPDDTDAFPGLGGWTEEERWHLDPSAAGRFVEARYASVPAQNVQSQCVDQGNCTPPQQVARTSANTTHDRQEEMGETIERGYRFGDSADYPIRARPDSSTSSYSYSYLVSPLISLQSLPVSVPPERKSVPGYGGVGFIVGTTPGIDQTAGIQDESDLTFQSSRVPATGGPSDPGHIVLYVDHKYHFGFDTASSTAVDGGAVLLLGADGTFLATLSPIRGTSFLRNDGQPSAFSGAQLQFVEEAFDLTQWAGQDVRLVFDVGIRDLNGQTPQQYFSDPNMFHQGSNFYGWAISNVRVEGPAHRHNVRLDRAVYPDVGTDVTPVRLGDEPFSFLLLNRGQVEEDVQVTMTADVRNAAGEPNGTVECPVVGVTLEEPGEAREIDFTADGTPDGPGCLNIEPDWTYDVTVRATTARDLYPADNELSFTVKGKAPDIRLAERITATPSLVDREDEVTLSIDLHNAALDDQEVVLDLSAHWSPVDDDKPTEEWVQGDTSLMEADGGPAKRVTVDAGTIESVSWNVTVKKAGLYTLHVNASRPDGSDPFFVKQSVNVGVLTAPEHAFRDNFDVDGIGEIRTKVRADTNWAVESRVNVEPPSCSDESEETPCHTKVWEMSDASLPQHTMVGLRGEFQPHPDRRDVPIQNVQVEILHYAEDIRCSSVSTCPGNPLSVRIVDRQPMPQNQFFAQNLPTGFNPALTMHGNGAPGQWANTILQVGGDPTRNAYYNGQWITEDINLTAINLQYETANSGGAVSQQLTGTASVATVPAARLEDMALDFVMSSSACPREDRACPLWRVAEVSVTAHPAPAASGQPQEEPMPILVWSGDEPDVAHGNLFSYYVTRSDSQSTVFYPKPMPFLGSLPGDELTPYTDDQDNEDHPMGDARFPVVVEHDGNETLRDNVDDQYEENDLEDLNATTHDVVNGTLNGTVWPQVDEDFGDRLAVDDAFPCDDLNAVPFLANVLSTFCGLYPDFFDYGDEDDPKRTPAKADDDWVTGDGCERKEDLQDETDRRFRCPTWELRDVDDLGGPAETTWHLDGDLGSYNHARPSADTGTYRYTDDTLEYLLSPILEIPQADGTKLTIDHRYKLHPYDDNEIGDGGYSNGQEVSPSFADSAMLMVRFMEPEDVTTPVTPFMPVNLPAVQAMPVDQQVQNFRTGCNPCVADFLGAAAEEAERLEFDLESFTYFDHSRASLRQNVFPNVPQAADITQCAAGGEPGGDDACIVQFAFRLQVPPAFRDANRDHQEAKDSARTNLPSGSAEGWFIDAISISEATEVPFDLSVTGVEIETEGYDWMELGFGPGGEATANITVRNDGVFPLSEVAFNVTLQDPDDPSVRFHHEVRPEDGFSVPEGETGWAEVDFDLPADEGKYVMSFCAFVVGELEPGVLLEDDPEDDCLLLEHTRPGQEVPVFHPRDDVLAINETTQTHELDLDEVGIVATVEAKEALEFDRVDITPRQGRKSVDRTFPRQVFIEVNNTGNVVVHDATLTRTITPAKGSATTESWIIAESPVPGKTANWTELKLLDPDFPGEDKDAEPYIYLEKAGAYFVTASIAGGCDECSRSIKLESFNTIYSNTFKPRGSGIHSDFGIRDPVQIDDAWRSTTGLGLEQDATLPPVHMLQFGDPAIDQYPDDTDAVVSLPPTDLSNFRSSSLTITHNYDLEEGYDGARAEACIGVPQACADDDATWHVLEPTSHTEARPTLGRVAAHGPFVPDNDPTESDLDRAFTGSSRDRAPGTAGWVIDEFDLAQLPGFARPVAFERFDQAGMTGSRLNPATFAPVDGLGPRVSSHPSWTVGGGSCPDDCWFRENLNKMNPPPLDGQDGYWWTPGDRGASILEAYVNATIPDGWQARINFTAWTMSGTGAAFVFDPDQHYVDPDKRLTWLFDGGSRHFPNGHPDDPEDIRNIRFYWEDLCYGTRDLGLHEGNKIDHGQNDISVFCNRNQLSGWGTEDLSFDVLRKGDGEARYNLSVEWVFNSGTSDAFTRGMAIGDVRMEVFQRHLDGSEMIREVIPFLRNDAITPEYGYYTDNVNHQNWAFVPHATDTPEDWGIADVDETRTGVPGEVWRFGHLTDPTDPDEGTTYENDAWERLVTPRIDLSDIVGDEITLSYFEDRCMHGRDRTRVLVQAITPAPPPAGEHVGEWEDAGPVGWRTGGTCGWRQHEIDLDAEKYKGRTIRIAFEAQTTNQVARAGWLIDEVTIAGGSMVGEPVQLRLRAGTDDSIHEGHWKVQELQLVGIKYKGNVAVLPDEPLVDDSIRQGGTMELSGQVRNLGGQEDVRLQLAVDDADGLEVEVCTRTPPCVTGMGTVTGEIETLYDVGQRGDRLDYHVTISFPDAADQYEFALRLVDSSGDPINDENIGDHERRFVVEADDETGVLRSGLLADPPTVDPEENTTLRLDAWLDPSLDGPATLDHTVQVTLNVTRLDEESETIVIDERDIGVSPDGTTPLDWDWSTEQRGFYRFNATAISDSGQEVSAYTHVMVGMTPVYLQEDFAQDPFENDWNASTEDTAPEWIRSEQFSQTAGGSLFVGSMDGSYPGPGTSVATTPPIRNFSWLVADDEGGEKAIRDGSSVFAPRLAMAYQPRLFGTGSDDAVELQVLRGDNRLRFADDSSVTFSGREQTDWRIGTVPLYRDDDNPVQGQLSVGEDTTAVLSGEEDSFAFVFAPQNAGQQGFAIDRVSVSSYNVVVAPENVQEADLQVGSEKTYYFRVENTGAARDTYTLEVRTSLPHGVDVEVVPDELALEAGQTGLVAVQVDVPYEDHLKSALGESSLFVDIASNHDLTRVATGKIAFGEVGPNLADFVTEVRRPAGAELLTAGDQAMFIVDVTNEGDRTTLPTDVVLFACPEQELQACLDPDASPEPVEIGTRPLPALDYGESSSPTFSWILPVNTTGDQIIVAVADPEQIVPEYDPHNSIFFFHLEVDPLDWPELQVERLRVLDAAGNDVRHAFARDHLTIEATLTNVGNAVAEGVSFEIKNQFTLIDRELDELAPGESVQLRTTWIAETGNWRVIARAESDSTEQDLDNNKKGVSLTVQEGLLEARLDPPTLSLDRGGDAAATLTLKNHRDRDVALDLVAGTSDPEVMVQGLPGAVDVARGATVAIPLAIKATPFASSGQHDVRIDAVSDGDVAASVEVDVSVDVHRAIRLTHPPVLATPGAATVDLVFTNDGDAEETLVVELGAPDGWNATVLQPTLELEPGAERTVRVLLDIPSGTLPGRHVVAIRAGDLIDHTIPVEVTRQVAWRSTVETVSVASGRVDALVRVENVGNAAGAPWFSLDDASVTLSIDPSPSDVQPGHARSYVLSLPATDDTPGLLLPGRDAPVPFERETSSQAEPLGLTGPPGDVRAGEPVLLQARVRNAEAQAQSVPVRLWVDGALVDERHVVLEAGESRNVELRWAAALAGEHALTVTTGAGDESVGRTLVLHAAEKDIGIPGPGLVAVALVLAAAGLARRRRP